MVLNGRLRALTEKDDGGVNIVGEYGQGDTVGELDVITSSTRRTTLHAIRDTELARMPMSLFNAISIRYVDSCDSGSRCSYRFLPHAAATHKRLSSKSPAPSKYTKT